MKVEHILSGMIAVRCRILFRGGMKFDNGNPGILIIALSPTDLDVAEDTFAEGVMTFTADKTWKDTSKEGWLAEDLIRSGLSRGETK